MIPSPITSLTDKLINVLLKYGTHAGVYFWHFSQASQRVVKFHRTSFSLLHTPNSFPWWTLEIFSFFFFNFSRILWINDKVLDKVFFRRGSH